MVPIVLPVRAVHALAREVSEAVVGFSTIPAVLLGVLLDVLLDVLGDKVKEACAYVVIMLRDGPDSTTSPTHRLKSIINKMGLRFFPFWIRDVFCIQYHRCSGANHISDCELLVTTILTKGSDVIMGGVLAMVGGVLALACMLAIDGASCVFEA